MALAETFIGNIGPELPTIVPAFQRLPYDGTLSVLSLASAFRWEDSWSDDVFIIELTAAYRLLTPNMPDVNIPEQLILIINNILKCNPQDPRVPLIHKVIEQLSSDG